MRNISVKLLIEATASQSSRCRPDFFNSTEVDKTAVALWEKYASGNTGGDALDQAIQLRSLTKEKLYSRFSFVTLITDEEKLLRNPDFFWINDLLTVLQLYRTSLYEVVSENDPDTILSDDVPDIILYKAIKPFIEFAVADITKTHTLSDKLKCSVACYFFNEIMLVLQEPFLIYLKSIFDTAEISFRHLESDSEKRNQFLFSVYSDGIVDVIEQYPMAFKITLSMLNQLVKNVQTLLNRLDADRQDISDNIHFGESLGEMINISFGLSDHHNLLQTVCIIQYQFCRVVYKPRNMAIDVAWNSFLIRLNKLDATLFQLTPLKVINKDTYGYVSFAEQRNGSSEELFYFNAGVLLCIASMLGATDLHYENIIASGDSPMIIDLETIISPKPKDRYALLEKDKLKSYVINVARTLLLSKWVGETSGGAREIGGLISTHESGKNYHILGTKKTAAFQYSEPFIRGFFQAYSYIIDNKRTIIEIFDSCNFSSCKVRYVFRRTALYYKLYRHFLQAAFLKRATLYESVVTRIGAGIVVSFDGDNASYLWPLEQSEELAVSRGDIPYFWCCGSKTDLESIDGVLLCDFFEMPPVKMVHSNIKSMNNKRLNYELSYVKKSLTLSSFQPQDADISLLVSYRDIKRERKTADENAIRKEIERLHHVLEEYNLDDLDFEYFAPVRNMKTTRYNLELLNQSLYSGIWGVMLFHSAYAVWKKDDFLQSKLIKKIKQLSDAIFSSEDESLFLITGIADGVAGICHALRCLATILNKPEFLDDAASILLRTSDYLSRCTHSDYFGGLAGYIYIACQLYKQTKAKNLLSVIKQATEIMCSRISYDEKLELMVWKTESEYAPLTGLAHGQAGYAIALATAYSILGEEQLKSILNDLLQYEKNNYCLSQNNWYDYRKFLVKRRDFIPGSEYHNRFMYGNCSGTPGIGLSRLAIMDSVKSVKEQNIIEKAISFCSSHELVGCDSLCCGTTGWIDFLMEAYNRKQEPCLLYNARIIATSIIPQISNERYLLSNLKGIYDVSMFTGISGIGYEMLRTEMPFQIPSPII